MQTYFETGSAVIGLGKVAMAAGKTTSKALFIRPGAHFSERRLLSDLPCDCLSSFGSPLGASPSSAHGPLGSCHCGH